MLCQGWVVGTADEANWLKDQEDVGSNLGRKWPFFSLHLLS